MNSISAGEKNAIKKRMKRAQTASHEHLEGYDDHMAIEFERLEAKSFNKNFFENMEEINYARFVEQDKFKSP